MVSDVPYAGTAEARGQLADALRLLAVTARQPVVVLVETKEGNGGGGDEAVQSVPVAGGGRRFFKCEPAKTTVHYHRMISIRSFHKNICTM